MFHDHHLLHKRLGRIVTGTVLTVAMSIASPAGVWRWLEGLLTDRMGAVPHNWAPPSPAAHRPSAQAKDLVCPPTGCPTTPTPTQGSGTDPDGRTH